MNVITLRNHIFTHVVTHSHTCKQESILELSWCPLIFTFKSISECFISKLSILSTGSLPESNGISQRILGGEKKKAKIDRGKSGTAGSY